MKQRRREAQRLFLLSAVDKFTGSRIRQTDSKACLCDSPPLQSWANGHIFQNTTHNDHTCLLTFGKDWAC